MVIDKKIGARYVSQALEILGKIPIEDSPNGDGSPRKGRIMRLEAIRYYLQLSECQHELPSGLEAMNMTLLRADGMVRTRPQAEVVVDHYVRVGYAYRATNLLKKFDNDGLLRVKCILGRTEFDEEMKSLFREGVEKSKSMTDVLERFTRLLDFVAVINQVNDSTAEAEKQALCTQAKELISKFPPYDKIAIALALCRAISLGVNIETGLAEARLREAISKNNGYLALGLYWLDKNDESKAILKKITPKDPSSSIPAELVTVLSPDEFIGLATQMKNTMVLVDAVNNTQYPRDNETYLAFLDAAERIMPLPMRYYVSFFPRLYGPLDADHKAKWRIKQQKEISSTKESERNASEIVRIAAWVDPVLAQKYLPRITDPESKVAALTCLAQAELLAINHPLA
jgi:hypothetical protein